MNSVMFLDESECYPNSLQVILKNCRVEVRLFVPTTECVRYKHGILVP